MADLRPSGDYLLIMDASSFIHRNYHALPKLTRQTDGLQTGALYGFCNTMLKLFRLNWSAIERLPAYGVIVMDSRGKNWRHDIFAAYKANRKGYEADLEAQLPWIPRIADAFQIPCLSVPGFEADDTIATLARTAANEGLDVIIATSDKDLCQLVEAGPPGITIYDGMKDKGPDERAGALLGTTEVLAKFGVRPEQIADFLALTGDSVDNVPGVPSFGPKTAARLLYQFGDLHNLIEEADWSPERFEKSKEREKIMQHVSEIRISRELVALREDVPLEIEIDDLYLKAPPAHQIRGLLMDLEFLSLVEKVDRPPRF